MLTPTQLQQIYQISDTILYPEAVALIHRLIDDEDCFPLPNSQVMGLWNISNATTYNELDKFIKHQRDATGP